MGISGLLPLLRDVMTPTHISAYANLRVGIDAYAWIHRGCYTCADDLCKGIPTKKWIEWCLNKLQMLIKFQVVPVLVFDGAPLPAKRLTEESRRSQRESSLLNGRSLSESGDNDQAHKAFQKSVDVTPEMALQFINELKRLNLQYIVAPYEADAQLAYLSITGDISVVITEDSDLLVFGCKRVLYKLDQYGNGVEFRIKTLPSASNGIFNGFTKAQFQSCAIMGGCDYLNSIEGIGIKKAINYIQIYKTIPRALQALRMESKYDVPNEYESGAEKALLTFNHQRVYCPKQRKLVHLNPLTMGEDEFKQKYAQAEFLGPMLEEDIAIGLAEGVINPDTLQPYKIHANLSIFAINSQSASSSSSSSPSFPTYDGVPSLVSADIEFPSRSTSLPPTSSMSSSHASVTRPIPRAISAIASLGKPIKSITSFFNKSSPSPSPSPSPPSSSSSSSPDPFSYPSPPPLSSLPLQRGSSEPASSHPVQLPVSSGCLSKFQPPRKFIGSGKLQQQDHDKISMLRVYSSLSQTSHSFGNKPASDTHFTHDTQLNKINKSLGVRSKFFSSSSSSSPRKPLNDTKPDGIDEVEEEENEEPDEPGRREKTEDEMTDRPSGRRNPLTSPLHHQPDEHDDIDPPSPQFGSQQRTNNASISSSSQSSPPLPSFSSRPPPFFPYGLKPLAPPVFSLQPPPTPSTSVTPFTDDLLPGEVRLNFAELPSTSLASPSSAGSLTSEGRKKRKINPFLNKNNSSSSTNRGVSKQETMDVSNSPLKVQESQEEPAKQERNTMMSEESEKENRSNNSKKPKQNSPMKPFSMTSIINRNGEGNGSGSGVKLMNPFANKQ